MEAFRARYRRLFEDHRDVSAVLVGRVACGDHAVDHERWSRTSRATGQATAGEVLVRYTGREGRIALVQFLR
jgi:hypothetical protein